MWINYGTECVWVESDLVRNQTSGYDSRGWGGGGGGGSTPNIFGWGCAARSWKPLPYFRPKYTIFDTLLQTWLSQCIPYFKPCDVWQIWQLSIDLQRMGLRDAPNDVHVLFSSWSMSTATHVTLKMVSQAKQMEYTPYFRQKWQNLYPISDRKCSKMIPFGPVHTYMAYIWEYPPPPPPVMTIWFVNHEYNYKLTSDDMKSYCH